MRVSAAAYDDRRRYHDGETREMGGRNEAAILDGEDVKRLVNVLGEALALAERQELVRSA